MLIFQLRQQIAHDLNLPHSRQSLEQRLQELAAQQSKHLAPEAIAGITELKVQYISETVGLIEACAVTANQTGIGKSIARVGWDECNEPQQNWATI